jgi:hypothetical protein
MENTPKENTTAFWKSEYVKARRLAISKEKTDTRLQILVSNFERLAEGGDMEFKVGDDTVKAHSAIGIYNLFSLF